MGCATTSADAAEEQVGSGRLQLPLTTEVDGRVYRLSASIYVWPHGWLNTGPDEPMLSVELPTGTYQAQMSSWYLERRDEPSGAFYPVSATLASYYREFSIFNGTTTNISFAFEVLGETITVGAGALNVTFDINELAPACAALGELAVTAYGVRPRSSPAVRQPVYSQARHL
jgi:hypothetical protein